MKQSKVRNFEKNENQFFAECKNWFIEYVDSFINDDVDYVKNITLKKEHTLNVCSNIKDIGLSLKLNASELCIAEVIALFHDLGRFEQYRNYRTFSDSKSVNHAELGVDILERNGILDSLNEAVRELILKAVKYHNHALVPKNETIETVFFAQLIRDADKLDIYRIVTEYYRERGKGIRNKTIELDLADKIDISDKVSEQVLNKCIVDIKNIRTLNDFKLLQMSWVFDVNFLYSFNAIKTKNYLNQICDSLPQTKLTAAISEVVFLHLNECCGKIKI
jgi:hypothetical protein